MFNYYLTKETSKTEEIIVQELRKRQKHIKRTETTFNGIGETITVFFKKKMTIDLRYKNNSIENRKRYKGILLFRYNNQFNSFMRVMFPENSFYKDIFIPKKNDVFRFRVHPTPPMLEKEDDTVKVDIQLEADTYNRLINIQESLREQDNKNYDIDQTLDILINYMNIFLEKIDKNTNTTPTYQPHKFSRSRYYKEEE